MELYFNQFLRDAKRHTTVRNECLLLDFGKAGFPRFVSTAEFQSHSCSFEGNGSSPF